MTLEAGARLGPYQIIAPLGAGGMGEVFKARDTRLGREVAIKVLPAGAAADPERRARFEQEARSASALNHPNIITLFDIGDADGVGTIKACQEKGAMFIGVDQDRAIPPLKQVASGRQPLLKAPRVPTGDALNQPSGVSAT